MNKIVTLRNGVRIFLDPREEMADVGIAIVIGAGSRYEVVGGAGLTHHLEHLMYTDSAAYKSQFVFARRIDKFAAEFLAFTSQEFMTFTFETMRSDTLQCLTLAGNAMMRPRINRATIIRELRRINNEGLLEEDDAEIFVQELIEGLVFKGSNLSRSISYNGKNPTRLTVAGMKKLNRTVVRGKKIVVCVIGNFDKEKTLERIKKVFGRLPSGDTPFAEPFVSKQTRLRLCLVDRPRKIVQIAIGFPTFGLNHRDRLTLSLINNHFGAPGRHSSRLAEVLDFVYWRRSEVSHYSDAGQFIILTGVEPETVITVLKIIKSEIARLYQSEISDEDLRLAKKSLKRDVNGRRYMATTEANFFGRQILLTGGVIKANKFIRAINKIGADDIRRVARRVFRPSKMSVVMIGPIQSLDRKQIASALRFNQ